MMHGTTNIKFKKNQSCTMWTDRWRSTLCCISKEIFA